MAKKRRALGRGLGALLDDSSASTEQKEQIKEQVQELSNFKEISVSQIETNPYQPRTHFDEDALNDLAESIRVQGIIQPITVRRLSENEYQLISGERRFQASQRAGLDKVPAYIRTANDQEMLEMALIENIQRENLNAIEVALSYQRLLHECELKQEELGDRVGKKRSTVNNYLRLLKLPPSIQMGVRDGIISMGHARAILGIEDVDAQIALYERVVREELSVRRTEQVIKESLGNSDTPKENPSTVLSYEMNQLQGKLSSHFGTKINIKSDNKHKGEIKIPFISLEDLNRILEILEM